MKARHGMGLIKHGSKTLGEFRLTWDISFQIRANRSGISRLSRAVAVKAIVRVFGVRGFQVPHVPTFSGEVDEYENCANLHPHWIARDQSIVSGRNEREKK